MILTFYLLIMQFLHL